MSGDLYPSFLERTQDRHPYPPGMGARVRLGAKADLAGNDGGPEIPFRKVIVRRDPAVIGSVVHARVVLAEDILDASDS